MLKDIIDVQPLDGYRLQLRFENGVEGTVDLAKLLRFEGVFAPLRDREKFIEVRVHPELGTIVWPNGADLDPDVLYSQITGEPIGTSWHNSEKIDPSLYEADDVTLDSQ